MCRDLLYIFGFQILIYIILCVPAFCVAPPHHPPGGLVFHPDRQNTECLVIKEQRNAVWGSHAASVYHIITDRQRVDCTAAGGAESHGYGWLMGEWRGETSSMKGAIRCWTIFIMIRLVSLNPPPQKQHRCYQKKHISHKVCKRCKKYSALLQKWKSCIWNFTDVEVRKWLMHWVCSEVCWISSSWNGEMSYSGYK